MAEAKKYVFFLLKTRVRARADKSVIVMKQDGSRYVRLMSCDHCQTKSCKQQQQNLVTPDMSLTKAIQPSNHSMHSTKNLSLLVLVMVVQIQNSSCCSWLVIFILVLLILACRPSCASQALFCTERLACSLQRQGERGTAWVSSFGF